MSNKTTAKPVAPKRSVAAYLDHLTNILTVVLPNGTTVLAVTAPEDVHEADESTRLLWARNRVEEAGYQTMTKFRPFDYPWGTGFNVRQDKRTTR